MAGGSISIGGNADRSTLVAGDGNTTTVTQSWGPLPAPESVDIKATLQTIRAVLTTLGGEQAGKIGRALEDAEEEAAKPKPRKDEVGSALERALGYAKQANGMSDELGKLTPHLRSAAAWLGDNWHRLLPLVGLIV